MTQRILLLDCNRDIQSGEIFHRAVAHYAKTEMEFERVRISGDVEALKFDWMERAKQGAYAGMIISGSAAGVHTGPAWVAPLAASVRVLTSQGLPTLGICFGHQLLAYAWGGEVIEDRLGYKIRGFRKVTVADEAQASPMLLPGGQGEITVLASHRDQVVQVPLFPHPWKVVAHSPECPIQAMRAPHLPITSVQWHPEADADFILDSPHPDWDALVHEDIVGLDGNQILMHFVHSLSSLR